MGVFGVPSSVPYSCGGVHYFNSFILVTWRTEKFLGPSTQIVSDFENALKCVRSLTPPLRKAKVEFSVRFPFAKNSNIVDSVT